MALACFLQDTTAAADPPQNLVLSPIALTVTVVGGTHKHRESQQ